MTDDNPTYSLGRSWLSAIIVMLVGIGVVAVLASVATTRVMLKKRQ